VALYPRSSRIALGLSGLLALSLSPLVPAPSAPQAARQQLVITPSPVPDVTVGQAMKLVAVGNGQTVNAQWAISDPLVATINEVAGGLNVVGKTAGKSLITARWKSVTAQTTLTVVSTSPPPQEVCGNGIDDDRDGQIDEGCPVSPPPAEVCGNGIDDDKDGVIDEGCPSVPDDSQRGPQTSIVCPSASIPVLPGESIQSAINANPGAPLCLKAGTHHVSASIHPTTGQIIVGEFGAVLDGTGWSTSDETAAAIRCTSAQGVTIRNLTIRNMPKKGIYTDVVCEHWTLEHNRIENSQWGVRLAGSPLTLRRNILQGSGRGVSGGNYAIYMTRNPVLIESNEIAYGGDQQKAMNTGPVTWRGNWVHHNDFAGIWNDGEGNGSVLEQNTIEDNAGPGIMWELSYGGTIRQNIIRRSGDQAIYVSTSRDTVIEGNTLEDNWRGVTLYLSCQAMMQGWAWKPDLANNTIRGTITRVGTRAESMSSLLAVAADCSTAPGTSIDTASYLSNAKNNRFESNRYEVPSLSINHLFWVGWKSWSQWQALGHDVGGSLVQR
jgi:parallel beta-helix repeat protein